MIRWLLGRCWRHRRITARNESGDFVLRCLDCLDDVPVQLDGKTLKGPKHVADPVAGQPLIRAQREGRKSGRVLPHSAGRNL